MQSPTCLLLVLHSSGTIMTIAAALLIAATLGLKPGRPAVALRRFSSKSLATPLCRDADLASTLAHDVSGASPLAHDELRHTIPLRESWYRNSLKHKPLLEQNCEQVLGFAVNEAHKLKVKRNALEETLGRPPSLSEWAEAAAVNASELSAKMRHGNACLRELVEMNMRIVYALTGKYMRYAGSVEFEDIAQEGALGLIRAASKWNPGRGVRFSTFAWKAVRNAVVSAVAAEGSSCSVPNSALYLVHTMRVEKRRLLQELGRLPSDEELARRMGLSERRLKTLELAARMASPSSSTSLDIVRREFATTYLDALESKSLAPDTALEVSDRVEQGSLRVRMALERTLTEKERCVVAWRFGLRPEDRGRAPDALPMFTKRDKVRRQRQYADRSILEVADAVGLSGTRTNDILRSALQKLRTSHYAGELRESLNDFDAWGA